MARGLWLVLVWGLFASPIFAGSKDLNRFQRAWSHCIRVVRETYFGGPIQLPSNILTTPQSRFAGLSKADETRLHTMLQQIYEATPRSSREKFIKILVGEKTPHEIQVFLAVLLTEELTDEKIDFWAKIVANSHDGYKLNSTAARIAESWNDVKMIEKYNLYMAWQLLTRNHNNWNLLHVATNGAIGKMISGFETGSRYELNSEHGTDLVSCVFPETKGGSPLNPQQQHQLNFVITQFVDRLGVTRRIFPVDFESERLAPERYSSNLTTISSHETSTRANIHRDWRDQIVETLTVMLPEGSDNLKLEEQRQALVRQLENITGDSIFLPALDKTIDQFISTIGTPLNQSMRAVGRSDYNQAQIKVRNIKRFNMIIAHSYLEKLFALETEQGELAEIRSFTVVADKEGLISYIGPSGRRLQTTENQTVYKVSIGRLHNSRDYGFRIENLDGRSGSNHGTMAVRDLAQNFTSILSRATID